MREGVAPHNRRAHEHASVPALFEHLLRARARRAASRARAASSPFSMSRGIALALSAWPYVRSEAAGGVVTVGASGKGEILDVRIDPQAVRPEDAEMLQDLVIAAVNEGIRKAQEMAASEMGKITGGMQIPGLM